MVYQRDCVTEYGDCGLGFTVAGGGDALVQGRGYRELGA